jgi:hypothetical protein
MQFVCFTLQISSLNYDSKFLKSTFMLVDELLLGTPFGFTLLLFQGMADMKKSPELLSGNMSTGMYLVKHSD